MAEPALINLCMLKMSGYLGPSFFDDTVIAVEHGLRRAGLRARILTNTITVDALNIVWGAGTHLGRDLAAIRATARPENSVIFNMEQLASDSVLVDTPYLDFLRAYRVLDYNEHNLQALRQARPGAVALELPVLPAAALATGTQASVPVRPRYDVAFYGALTPRREVVLAELERRGLSVLRIQGAFGPELSQALLDVRLVLNVHCYTAAIFEIARVLRPLALGVPVVSETSVMPDSVDWTRSGIVFADYEQLADQCEALVVDTERRHQAVRQSFAFLGDDTSWVQRTREVIEALMTRRPLP